MKLGLIKGRHDMPVDAYILREIADPTDINAIDKAVAEAMPALVGNAYKVDLYVTGLTVALISVINWCLMHGVQPTFWHYDTSTGKYYGQDLAVDAETVYEICGEEDARVTYDQIDQMVKTIMEMEQDRHTCERIYYYDPETRKIIRVLDGEPETDGINILDVMAGDTDLTEDEIYDCVVDAMRTEAVIDGYPTKLWR